MAQLSSMSSRVRNNFDVIEFRVAAEFCLKEEAVNMDQKDIRGIVREYRERLEEIFGDQLRSVILYGSMARNEGREDSDIDLLCVLRGSFNYGEAIRKSSELTAGISLEHDVVLSRIFVSEEDFASRNLPFFMNVRREGVPV